MSAPLPQCQGEVQYLQAILAAIQAGGAPASSVPASGITGTMLASNVVNSSLHSIGTGLSAAERLAFLTSLGASRAQIIVGTGTTAAWDGSCFVLEFDSDGNCILDMTGCADKTTLMGYTANGFTINASLGNVIVGAGQLFIWTTNAGLGAAFIAASITA